MKVVGSNMGPPKIVFSSQSAGPVMTIHPDGRITLGDDAKPTEAAAECIKAMDSMIQNLIGNAVQAERNRVVSYLQTNADPIVRNWISAQIEAKEHL